MGGFEQVKYTEAQERSLLAWWISRIISDDGDTDRAEIVKAIEEFAGQGPQITAIMLWNEGYADFRKEFPLPEGEI